MNPPVLQLCCLLLTTSAPLPEPRQTVADTLIDEWFAVDKAQHLTLSFATTMYAYSAARTLGAAESESAAIAVASAAAAGIAKEVLDRRKGGPFSLRDLVADAIGIAIGSALLAASR